jgi:bacillithiol system protein YtxJ
MHVDLRQEQDLEQLLERSHQTPVVIVKHSTQCSRSAAAYAEFEAFMADHPEVPCGTLLVIEDRPLSNAVEARFGIRHESPQTIVVAAGAPVWHASHWDVTARNLEDALAVILRDG